MTGKFNFALYVLMFNMFIAFSGIGLIIPIMPQYLETFGVAGQALGFLVALLSFSQFVFSPIAGNLSDKHGRKKLIIFGLVVFGLSQLLFGLSNQLWLLYVARFISGIGSAFLIPPTMAFVADVTTYEERGKGMSYLAAAISLGFMIGPGIGGYLSKVSLEFPFFVATAVALLAALISSFALPNIVPVDKPKAGAVRVQENLLQQLVRSVHTPYFILLIIVFVFSFGLANFQSTITLYMDKFFHYSPSTISIVLTAGGFTGVIVQTFLIDRLFKAFGEIKVILFNLLIAAISLFCVLFVNEFWSILTVATIFSTATAILRPSVNTIISKFAGEEQGFAAGMNNAYMSLGNMVGPALAGVLFDINMSYPYYLGTIILFISLLITFVWYKRNEQTLTHMKHKEDLPVK